MLSNITSPCSIIEHPHVIFEYMGMFYILKLEKKLTKVVTFWDKEFMIKCYKRVYVTK